MLAIHRALVGRGERPLVATHGGAHEQRLVEAGVPFTLVGPHMSAERGQRFVREGAGMGSPRQSMWSDEELMAYVRAEARFFREHGVRVAVTGFTLTTLLSTRLAGIKLVTEHAGSFVPPIWEREMVEPFLDSPLPPVRFLPRAARHWFANLGIHHVQHYCSGFNRVAKQLGIEGVPSFAALLLGDVTLVPEAPSELDAWCPGSKGYRAGTRLRYTGPLFAELDRPIPDRVEKFLAGPRPIAYVAITSSTADQVRAVVSALRAAELRVLVAGTIHELSDLEREDVMVGGVLPSHRVMPRVDLAITAGGQGSVQCALAAGTPLISIPLQPEQDWNGQLLERHGAGERISMRDAASPKLAKLARAMLATPSYRAGAQRIRNIYAQLDGPNLAADVILDYARSLGPSVASAAQ
jgi:UDP:flavonoid glycosyltransferase YjiC (YdhE family)